MPFCLGSSDGSNSTCSSISNSYENDPNYVNTPINYRILTIESQNDIKVMPPKL